MTTFDMYRCACRELAMRRAVYPRLVKAGKMKQAAADSEIEAMAGIVLLLKGMVEPPTTKQDGYTW